MHPFRTSLLHHPQYLTQEISLLWTDSLTVHVMSFLWGCMLGIQRLKALTQRLCSAGMVSTGGGSSQNKRQRQKEGFKGQPEEEFSVEFLKNSVFMVALTP